MTLQMLKYATQRNATQRNATQQQPNLRLKLGSSLLATFLLLSPATFASSTHSAPVGSQDYNTYSEISEAVSAPITNIPQLSQKDQYGCSAYLCFAGGFAYPECQAVIRKVTRDLIRGKSFPTCSALDNGDGSVGGQNGSPRIFTQKSRKYIRVMKQNADGSVEQISSIKRRKF